MIEEVRRVAEIKDHAVRVRAAVELMKELQDGVMETARMRRESIAWLREHGYSSADIARLMGVSRARVAQLREAGPPPERAFLGVGSIRVAVPERPGGRRLVARADAATGQRILNLAHRMQLDGELEYIPVSGEIDLNRDSLVVVCGPKTSPVIADVLRHDPRLSFETLPDGRWALVERSSGRVHASPTDDPEHPRPADVAYLGRLPRPDGEGSFLLIAGVHAIGSLGVARYLDEHLGELYDEARTRRFSTVIGCEYDPDTEDILRTKRKAPVLLHGEG